MRVSNKNSATNREFGDCDGKATLCIDFVRAFQVTAGKFDKHIIQAGMPNSQVSQIVVTAEQLRDQFWQDAMGFFDGQRVVLTVPTHIRYRGKSSQAADIQFVAV